MSGALDYRDDEDETDGLGGGYGGGYGGYDQVAEAPAPGPARGGLNPVTSPGAGAAPPPAPPHLTPRGRAILEGIQASRAPPPAPEPVGDFYEPQTTIEAPVVEHGFAHDATRRIWAATKEMTSSVVSAAQMGQRAMGDSPEAIAWLERQNQALKASAEETLSTLSPNRQAAAHTKIFGDQDADPATGKPYPKPGEIGWATVLTDRALGFVPQFPLLFTGPAGWGGRIISGLLFGTMGAGDAYAAQADTIHAMTPEQLAANPVSGEILKGGGTPDQARDALLKGAAVGWQAWAATAGGAAVGVGLRGAVKPGEAVGRALLPRTALGAAEAGGVLGAQSGGMETLQQSAEMGLGVRQEFDQEKIALSAASGALGGVALGGIAAGVLGRRPASRAPTPEVRIPEGVAADQHAAMETALGPVVLPPQAPQYELPLTQAPPGFTQAGGPQGTLFRDITEANPGQVAAPAPPGGAVAPQPNVPIGTPANVTPPVSSIGPTPAPVVAPAVRAEPPAIANPDTAIATPTPTAAPSRSAKLTRRELVDALSTAPGQDPRVLIRMTKADLAARYDQLEAHTVAEPAAISAAVPRETAQPLSPAPGEGVRSPAGAAATAPAAPRPETAASRVEPAALAAEIKPAPEPAPKPTTVVETPAPKIVEPKVEPPRQELVPATPAKTPQDIRREQVAAQVAKRAAVKAALKGVDTSKTRAETPPKPTTVVEPPPEITPFAPSGSIPEAGRQVAAALRSPGVKHEITMLRKGADVAPIIDQLERELMAHIADRRPKTVEDVHDAVAGWAASPDVITNTTKRRADVANPVMRMLTGKSLQEYSQKFKRATSAEDIHEVAAAESTPGAHGEVLSETAAGIKGEGMRSVEGEAAEVRRAPTTDHKKIADGLIKDVIAGNISIAEADFKFGKQGEGQGRKRRPELVDLATYLKHEIARAEAEDVAKIAATQDQAASEAHPNTKRGATIKLAHELDTAAQLKGMLRELTDPVGHAVDREEPPILAKADTNARTPTPDGLPDPGTSRYVRVARDPRLNQFIAHDLQERELTGEHYTTRDALKSVINDLSVKAEMRPMHEWAKILLRDAPELPVWSTGRALDNHLLSREEARTMVGATTTRFVGDPSDPKLFRPHIVVLREDMGDGSAQHVETLLHEITHTVTASHIDRLERLDPNHRDLLALDAIGDELARATMGADMPRQVRANVDYALTNRHELHTALLNDPTVQALAASHPASAEFRAAMSEFGFPPRESGRSVWRYFTDWMRRALGIRAPATVSEYTMLDHMLRPLQDIYAHAVAHNEKYLPRDPVLRDQAAPLFKAASGALGEMREAVAERVANRYSNVGDRLRGGVFMPSMPYDRMFDHWGKLFDTAKDNLMVVHRTAGEAIGRRGKQFTDDFHDRARGIAARLKGRDELAQLENDVGYAKVHLGNADPDANAHLTTSAQRTTLNALEGRYARLSAADRQTYQDHLAVARDAYAQERGAELTGLVDQFLPDATDIQKAAIRKALSSKGALDRFLADPENSSIAQAFAGDAEAWSHYREITKAIAKFHAQGFVQGDYFQMARLGNYVVVYGEEKNSNYGVEMFESRAEAEARRAELRALDVPDVQEVRERDQSAKGTPLPPSSITDELLAAAKSTPGLKANAAELADMLDQIRLRHMTYAEAARVRARRRGIAGASKEAARILSSSVLATGMRIGHLEHDMARVRALGAMRAHAGYLARNGGDAYTADQVIHELAKRDAIPEAAQHGMAALARAATSFGYAQSLASYSRLATEAVEQSLKAGAWLGARHGYARAGIELTRAMKDVSPTLLGKGVRNTLDAIRGELHQSNWNIAALARDRLIAKGYDRREVESFFKQFQDAGLFDTTYSRALQAMAKPGGFGPAWQRFLDFSGAMGHASEETSKIVTAWSAYRLERAKGATPAAARAYADTVTRKLPNWNPANKPRISTDKGILGKFSAPIMQFKFYGLNEYSLLSTLVRDSIKGATPEAKREARKAFAGVMAGHALMAGVLTWIADPVRYIGGAYDLITGAPAHDRQPDMRAFMSDTFGPELGEVLSRGAPHLWGQDWHYRLGIQNPLNIPQLNGFTKKDWVTFIGTALMGAAGEDAATVAGGFTKLAQGDLSGLTDVVPRIVRDPLKAAHLASQGVTDSTGKVVLAPEQLTPTDVASQALGFQPSRVSEVREKRNAILQMRTEWQGERTRLEGRWLDAEPADRAAIMSEIREWNQTHHGMGITQGQLLQLAQARRRQAKGPAGLRLPPKAARELSQAGRFAQP